MKSLILILGGIFASVFHTHVTVPPVAQPAPQEVTRQETQSAVIVPAAPLPVAPVPVPKRPTAKEKPAVSVPAPVPQPTVQTVQAPLTLAQQEASDEAKEAQYQRDQQASQEQEQAELQTKEQYAKTHPAPVPANPNEEKIADLQVEYVSLRSQAEQYAYYKDYSSLSVSQLEAYQNAPSEGGLMAQAEAQQAEITFLLQMDIIAQEISDLGGSVK